MIDAVEQDEDEDVGVFDCVGVPEGLAVDVDVPELVDDEESLLAVADGLAPIVSDSEGSSLIVDVGDVEVDGVCVPDVVPEEVTV